MLRRGFDRDHVSFLEPEPHAQYDAAFRKILAACGNGEGHIFALAGKRGTGKTQLATNVAGLCLRPDPYDRKGTDELTWPLYTLASGYFLELKQSWNLPKDGQRYMSQPEVERRFLLPCLLVIDEAHVRSETKWEDDRLSELVDRRCYRGRDTLILSNLDRKALSAALGPSIVSRIHERGGFVEFNWPSFREVPT